MQSQEADNLTYMPLIWWTSDEKMIIYDERIPFWGDRYYIYSPGNDSNAPLFNGDEVLKNYKQISLHHGMELINMV